MKNHFARIWLDDMRTPPDETYIWVKDYSAFVEAVQSLGKNISDSIVHFDHDLGPTDGGQDSSNWLTGYACAKWLVNWCMANDYTVPDYDIQSANPIGRQNIESVFKTYLKIFK